MVEDGPSTHGHTTVSSPAHLQESGHCKQIRVWLEEEVRRDCGRGAKPGLPDALSPGGSNAWDTGGGEDALETRPISEA